MKAYFQRWQSNVLLICFFSQNDQTTKRIKNRQLRNPSTISHISKAMLDNSADEEDDAKYSQKELLTKVRLEEKTQKLGVLGTVTGIFLLGQQAGELSKNLNRRLLLLAFRFVTLKAWSYQMGLASVLAITKIILVYSVMTKK